LSLYINALILNAVVTENRMWFSFFF
jgi:hypothetical protein